jgi:hypothetical protein
MLPMRQRGGLNLLRRTAALGFYLEKEKTSVDWIWELGSGSTVQCIQSCIYPIWLESHSCIPNTASWKVSELHIPNMARKSQLHIPNTVSWEVSELHIPNMARKSQLHIPNTVSWEVSELHIVHFDCYLHGFV